MTLRILNSDPPQCSTLPVAENRTGGGGGLYSQKAEVGEEEGFCSGTERRNQSSSSTSGEKYGVMEIAEAMRDLGVFLLAPPRRLQVARELAEAGLTGEQVRQLAEWSDQNEPDRAKSRRYLAKVLIDPTVARLAVDDLEAFRRAEAARLKPAAPAPAKDVEPGRSIREANMDSVRRFELEWQEFRRAKVSGQLPEFQRDPHPWEQRA